MGVKDAGEEARGRLLGVEPEHVAQHKHGQLSRGK